MHQVHNYGLRIDSPEDEREPPRASRLMDYFLGFFFVSLIGLGSSVNARNRTLLAHVEKGTSPRTLASATYSRGDSVTMRGIRLSILGNGLGPVGSLFLMPLCYLVI